MMNSKEKDAIICCKCNVSFIQSEAMLSYLGHQFTAPLLQCPICGMVYISETLVDGKIAQVEMSLEDK